MEIERGEMVGGKVVVWKGDKRMILMLVVL